MRVLFLLLFCYTAAQAQTLESFGVTGYRLGVFSYYQIKKDNVIIKEPSLSNRLNYAPTVPPATENTVGPLDSAGSKSLSLTLTDQDGVNNVAWNNSKLIAGWKYIAPGLTASSPEVSVEYLVDNKCAAIGTSPPNYLCTAKGWVDGYNHRLLRVKDANESQTYYIYGSMTITGSYTDEESNTLPPSRYALTLKANFGQSTLTAEWSESHQNEDDSYGAWKVTRHIQSSQGQFTDVTEWVESTTLNKTYGGHAKVVGSQGFTCGAKVGPSEKPLASSPSWSAKVGMSSAAGTTGTTGVENRRDEVWTGKVEVKPVANVYQVP